MSRPPGHAEFSVGWICALPLELAAARAILDEEFDNLPVQPNDHNTYTLGRVDKHNVVIACLPSGQYGIASAATVAMHMLSSFQSVRIGLLVGIGGGIPSDKKDVRLGDVVVGIPTSSNTHGGVVQYDLGKAGQGNKFERTGILNRPPQILLTAVSKLQAIHQMEGNRISQILMDIAKRSLVLHDILEAPHRKDLLFDADYHHNQTEPTCSTCDSERLIDRPRRVPEQPVIHYGLIASGNQVVKDSHFRDRLGRELGACCVDMEAAGLMNNFPCLVIRGICDYADSHKNKDWQGYAAAFAAAYAKELLLVTPPAIATAQQVSYLDLTHSGPEKIGGSSAAISEALKKTILSSIRPPTLEVPYRGQAHPVESAWDEMLGHSEYNTWYRGEEVSAHRGLVWVKGKPGSGKSTFLKLAFSRGIEELQRDGTSVVGFFFQPQDQQLHWTQLDLFRIIVYQLLQIVDDDFVDFIEMFGYKFQDAKQNVSWNKEELRSFLKAAFGKPRPFRTVIFVDGIDECEEDGMRELALTFREMTAVAFAAGAKLSVCLSSREYPKISVGECPEILIDRLNTEEIRRYVDRRLATAGLVGNEQWVELTTSLVDRASGVFLWVVIVMETLLKDWDNGKNLRYLNHRLQEIPPALEQLYERILSTTDGQDAGMTLRFFYWVILAARPLRLLEWHHIIAWIRDSPPTSLQDWRKSEYYTENTWQLERQIQDISKGLVEAKPSGAQQTTIERNSTCGDAGSLDSEEGETRTVRVIHSSVAEFFLRGRGFRVLGPSVSGQALALGHLSILSTCLDYIAIPELDVLAQQREKADRRLLHKGRHRPRRARGEASFGSSASSYAGSTHSDRLDWDHEDIHAFSKPLFWSPCGSLRSEPAPSEADLPVSGRMPLGLQPYLGSGSRIDVSPLERAASNAGSLCSETGLSQTLQEYPDLLLYIINAFTFHARYADEDSGDPEQILCRLITGSLWRRWTYLADNWFWDTTLLHFAAERGLVSWVKCLLSSGTDPMEIGGEYRYPLLAAVINKNKEATMVLLEGGASAWSMDNQRKLSLHHIAEGGCVEMLDCFWGNQSVRGIFIRGLIDARSDFDRTPLHLAVQRGHLSMTERLLALGAKPGLHDRDGKSALHYAAESEQSSMEICQVLLEKHDLSYFLTEICLSPTQLALEKGYLDRLSLIEDYRPPRKDQSPQVSEPTLEVRLIKIPRTALLKRPYIHVSFAGKTKTLYPGGVSSDAKTRREKVQFSITIGTKAGVELELFDIHGSRHVQGNIGWEVRYVTYKNGDTQTRTFRRSTRRMWKKHTSRFTVPGGLVILEVTVPPGFKITASETLITPSSRGENLLTRLHSWLTDGLVPRLFSRRMKGASKRNHKVPQKHRKLAASSNQSHPLAEG
ncbi:hypothetical protein BJX65DRAFT_14309 [Aspergillus insuetus]